MGVLVYILGRSGTGKSYSMRNFKKEEIGIVNVQGKILPFKGRLDIVNTDNPENIVKAIPALAKWHKTVVVDDFQYVMANEYMRRSTEKGYDKFTDIGRHAWDIANTVKDLPNDVIVYIMCHTDTDPDGFEKLKTIGKLLDEKIVLEGMSTIVLKTAVSDGQYYFLTQNNGHDTVKSPAGMFPSYAIDNDLKYVDEKIRSYYELGEHKTEEEMAEADAAAAHEEIQKEEKKKRGRKKKEEEPAETPEEEKKEEYPGAKEPFERAKAKLEAEKEEKPARGTRSRRISETLKAEREAAAEKMSEEAAKAGFKEAGDDEEVPFDEVEMPKPVELPKRKRRTVDKEEHPAEEETPSRRRGRRRTL